MTTAAAAGRRADVGATVAPADGGHVNGFKSFLLRGNVVDLAVAVVLGAAFSGVVMAFVSAFITPLVGIVSGASGDIRSQTFVAGGVSFPWGTFVDALLSFVLISAVVYFLVVRPVNRLMERFKTEPEVEQETVTCPECLSAIPAGARRCAYCTAEQPAAAR